MKSEQAKRDDTVKTINTSKSSATTYYTGTVGDRSALNTEDSLLHGPLFRSRRQLMFVSFQWRIIPRPPLMLVSVYYMACHNVRVRDLFALC
jgi:hypothetical protein